MLPHFYTGLGRAEFVLLKTAMLVTGKKERGKWRKNKGKSVKKGNNLHGLYLKLKRWKPQKRWIPATARDAKVATKEERSMLQA